MNFIYSNFDKKIIIMKNLTLIFTILSINLSISQNSNTNNNYTASNIINEYFTSIGGLKKINKIKTLHKKFSSEIVDAANINMSGELIFKIPDMYCSNLKIDQIGDIECVKYDGENCILTRNHNNKKIENQIEGEILNKKKIDFYPFPILQLIKENTLFKLLYSNHDLDTSYYKIQIQNHDIDTTFLFFDKNNNYLVKKDVIDGKTKNTTEYKNFKTINGIVFPFLEISTIEIDTTIVQTNIKRYTEITINKKFTKKHFQ